MSLENLEETIKMMENLLAKGRPRTVEEYVNCMTSHGRTLTQILTVANSTRWKGQVERIRETYHARASKQDEKVSS